MFTCESIPTVIECAVRFHSVLSSFCKLLKMNGKFKLMLLIINY